MKGSADSSESAADDLFVVGWWDSKEMNRPRPPRTEDFFQSSGGQDVGQHEKRRIALRRIT
jgi:hypothetical protein